jgi:hypothetical protein
MFYSAEEMTELVMYGANRGVRLIPCTGMMPGPGAEMVGIVSTNMLPFDVAYKYHDWMDEVDGKGTVLVFRKDFALADAIGSHACSLDSPLLLPLSS